MGKGLTFDTGGLKPEDDMSYIKSVMRGAAAMSGTIEMVAKLKLKVNIVVVLPFTENCTEGKAIKP